MLNTHVLTNVFLSRVVPMWLRVATLVHKIFRDCSKQCLQALLSVYNGALR